VAKLRQWADQAKEILRANPDMRGVNDSWNERPIKGAQARRRPRQGRALGVSTELGAGCHCLLSGSTINQYREGDKLIDRAAPAAGRSVASSPTSAVLAAAHQRRYSVR
jgi:multidrug efflux pump subunit AcrB